MGQLVTSRAVVSLIALGAVTGCASPPAPPPPPARVAQVPGMGWELTLASGADEAKLAFGMPDSETVVVMLTCRPGSGQVAVTKVESAAPARPEMVLSSDENRSRLDARSEPSEVSESVLVEAVAPVTDPVLASFTRTGALGLEVDGRRTAIPPADPAQARRFVETCRP